MQGIVVAPQPEAVDAGAEILRTGGNAVDAAVGCALVQSVVDPLMCGIAGFGTMQVWQAGSNRHVCIDFHATGGSLASPGVWADRVVGPTADGYAQCVVGNVNELGHQSIAIPATLKGLALALARYGRLSFADVAAPAIERARAGFMVRPFMYAAWVHDEDAAGALPLVRKLAHSSSGRRLFFRADGTLKRAGDHIVNTDLAATLERLARDGADDFYAGGVAKLIAADLARGGSFVTADDLRRYVPEERAPLTGRYRDFDVASAPLPGGGAHLIELLNVIEHFDVRALEHNSPDYIECVAAAMWRTACDRRRYLADPRFVDVPLARLLDKRHATAIAASIRRDPAAVPGAPAAREHPHTTQVCTADADGIVVSMTHSLGTPSGVITDGLGFMYNGSMSVFDPRPGHPGSIAPGKRRYSAIAPTLVLRAGAPVLALGAPGGAHITNAILQGILNVLEFDMTMAEAVAAPRFSAIGDAIHVSNRIPERTTRELARRGHRVVRSYQSYAFGGLHGLRFDRGRWSGGADPQRDGMALCV